MGYGSGLLDMGKLPEQTEMLEFTLSNICNSRCKMCDIGTEKFKRRELTIAEIGKALDSETAKRAKIISLCGGEPFLRKDFVKIVKLIRKKLGRKFNLNVSTNGLNTEKILDDIGRIINDADIVLVFSIDGLEKTHNAQRGLNDAFSRTMNTIGLIIKKFPQIEINMHLTITPLNYREILDVYNLAKSKNIFFRASFAHDTFYLTNFIRRDNPLFKFSEEQIKIIGGQLEKIVIDYIKEGHFGDALFLNQMPKRMRDSKHRFCRCFTSSNLVLIKENGDVHICVMSPPVGNINEDNLDKIFLSKKAQEVRKKAAEYKCPNCMMLCGSYFNYDRIGQLFAFFYNKNNFLLREGSKGILESYPLIKEGDKIQKDYSPIFVSLDGWGNKKTKEFLMELKKSKVNFEISKPLPLCLFDIKERKDINAFKHPLNCSDCKEMFITGKDGVIKFCDGLKGLEILDEMQKQFNFLRDTNKEKECYNDCSPFLRRKCQCLTNKR